MKKWKFSFLIILVGILFSFNTSLVKALDQDINLTYEIDVKNKVLNVEVIIPEDYDQDKIVVRPDFFQELNKSIDYLIGGELIKIDLKINNLSDNTYSYVNNSYKYVSDESILSKVLYKTYNDALKDIFKNIRVSYSDLSEENIDILLKNIGYKGYEDLDEYYLDFYNDKYKLDAGSISDFPDEVKKDIFTGEVYDIKESNQEIIDMAYEYFSKDILKLNYPEDDVNQLFLKEFKNIAETSEIDGISIDINNDYLTDTFASYNLSGDISFELAKINNVEKMEAIVPPKTDEKNNYQQILLLTTLLLVTIIIKKKIINN